MCRLKICLVIHIGSFYITRHVLYHIQDTVTMYMYKLYKSTKQPMVSCHDNNLPNLSFSWVVEIIYNPLKYIIILYRLLV